MPNSMSVVVAQNIASATPRFSSSAAWRVTVRIRPTNNLAQGSQRIVFVRYRDTAARSSKATARQPQAPKWVGRSGGVWHLQGIGRSVPPGSVGLSPGQVGRSLFVGRRWTLKTQSVGRGRGGGGGIFNARFARVHWWTY